MLKNKSWLIFITALFILVSLGCESQEPVVIEPDKPSSVPSEAIWVGGVDGGVFVLIKESESPENGEYWGEIYYVSGNVSYKGYLKAHPENLSHMDFNSRESYQGWDGDTLYLLEGEYLQILE